MLRFSVLRIDPSVYVDEALMDRTYKETQLAGDTKISGVHDYRHLTGV